MLNGPVTEAACISVLLILGCLAEVHATCSNPGEIGNGLFEPSMAQHEVKSVITYRCQNEFRLVGNRNRTCLDSGQWTGQQPTCERINLCFYPGAIRDGWVEPLYDKYRPGSLIRFRCRRGFKAVGDNTKSCQADGKWSGGSPTCEDVRECYGPRRIENGFFEPNLETNYALKSVITYGCQKDFRLVGGSTRTCRGGYWTGSDPRCAAEPKVTCPYPRNIEYGVVEPSDGRFIVNATVTYKCQYGFQLQGDTQRTCEESGHWSGSQPKCGRKDEELKQCFNPGGIGNGFVEPSAGKYEVNSVVTYRCQTGFKLVGDGRRTCLNEGRWSGVAPTCEDIKQCFNPGGIGNGFVEPNVEKYDVSFVISYRCRNGFKVAGNSTRTCRSDGHWSGEAPACEAIKQCFNPGGIGNGFFEPNVEKYAVKSVINYRCQNEFKLVGDSNRTCQGDGRWSGVAPRCDGILKTMCRYPGNVDHGFVEPSDGRFIFNATVTYKCQHGFKLIGDAQRTCQENGRWSGSQPKCKRTDEGQRKKCFNPGGIGSGHVDPNAEQYEVKSVISYRCENGFKLVGDQQRTCKKNGEWSGAQPRCESHRIPCLNPGEVGNGLVDPNLEKYEVDSMVSYRCQYGFQLVGERQRTCQPDGRWSGSQPRCEGEQNTTCRSPGVIRNGFLEPSMEEYVVNSVVTYRCQQEYRLMGDVTRTCLRYGQWSGSQPRCEREDRQKCPNPGGIGNGLVESNALEFEMDSVVTFDCQNGYRLIGERTTTCLRYGQWSASKPRCEEVGGTDQCERTLGRKCDANAECIEDVGAYRCRCKRPFSGDGFSCSECKGGQIWRKCVSYCVPTCDNPRPDCGAECDPNNSCKCKAGFVLKIGADETCVRKSKCK